MKSEYGWLVLVGMIFLVLMTNACHEGGHALVAWLAGDRRESIRRRCNLNPMNHLHWFLTIVLPVLSYWLTGFMLGGARPVMVHAGKIGPRRMALVALAGPVGNVLFAGFVVTAMGLAYAEGWLDDIDRTGDPTYRAVVPALWLSILFALLNLIPVPPLDGSRIVAMFMPERVRNVYYSLAPLGLVLAFAGYLWYSGFLYDHVGFTAFGRGNPEFFYIDMFDFIHQRLDAMKAFWQEVL